MSARLLLSSPNIRAAARRGLQNPINFASRRAYSTPTPSGGLLKAGSLLNSRSLGWPAYIYRSRNSGTLTTRAISFHRAIPKLFMKFAKLPAAFGGVTIAGLAYLQYQATRSSTPIYPYSVVLKAVQKPETTWSACLTRLVRL